MFFPLPYLMQDAVARPHIEIFAALPATAELLVVYLRGPVPMAGAEARSLLCTEPIVDKPKADKLHVVRSNAATFLFNPVTQAILCMMTVEQNAAFLARLAACPTNPAGAEADAKAWIEVWMAGMLCTAIQR